MVATFDGGRAGGYSLAGIPERMGGHERTAAVKILNLGCGTAASDHPDVVNIDWSVYLRVRRSAWGRALAPVLFRGERRARYDSLPGNVRVHDLSKGIPFPDGSVDVVYHSHLLEHLDREVAEAFLREVRRVLKAGGIHRIVVPDLEKICRAYLADVDACGERPEEGGRHDEQVAALLEQSVRRGAAGTSRQKPFRRWVEARVLEDARRRGETHQWMYDRINLGAKLRAAGHAEAQVRDWDDSAIPQWNELGLDGDGRGGPRKPGSLYMEARK